VSHPTNLAQYFELLLKFKRVFVKGGIKRMKYSIPALCFALFKLSNEIIHRGGSEGEHEVIKENNEDEV